MTPTKPLSQEEYDALIRDEIAKLEDAFLAEQAAAEARQQAEAEAGAQPESDPAEQEG